MSKGFTLVEILAVVVILAIIALITFPKIQNFLSDSKDNSYQLTVSRIVSKAQEYVMDNDLDRQVTAVSYLDISLSTLINENYINQKDLVDPRTSNKSINKNVSFVRVTLVNGQLEYQDYFTIEE